MNVFTKYNIPSDLVNEPCGTIYIVEPETEKKVVPRSTYVQVSNVIDAPHWVRLGDMLETIYGDISCRDGRFLGHIIDDYRKALEYKETDKKEPKE